MSCTTLLVGKNASYDGSTMIARNDDSGADGFTPKKFVVISSKEQKRKYKTVISHLEIDLPYCYDSWMDACRTPCRRTG